MWKHDDKIIYLWPMCGAETPPAEEPPPERVVTQDHASVYDPDTNTWQDWPLTAYRPVADASAINFASGGVATVVTAPPLRRLLIVSVALTVDDETNITLYASGAPISGPMDFGAANEPRGIVIPFPFSPLDCGLGGSFSVGSSDAVQVSGIVSYILV